MMRSILQLGAGILEWRETGDLSPQRRTLRPQDRELFLTWAQRYREALPKRDPWALTALGREIYAWLDDDHWLDRARRRGSDPPWLLEISVPMQPSAPESTFLEVPWELLADEEGPLAGQRDLVLCPVRRIGEKGVEAAPSQERLQTVFMAAAPDGEVGLDFEQEERAILAATGSIGMDLEVEESGNLKLLTDLLVRQKHVDVLHLSCHGRSEPPRLVLESEFGEPAFATAEDIERHLRHQRPQLLFLSACQTAAEDPVLGSFAATLVAFGFPALLGWCGFVADSEAIHFATELYASLAKCARVDVAVAYARFELLRNRENSQRSQDWHQARLFLGSKGGGVLVAGQRKRTIRKRPAFLDDRRGKVPVAGPREFVGRRRPLQQALRAFREETLGVLIHGMGRQGKSSLASRVLHRMHQFEPVVLHGVFSGPALLDTITDSVADPAVREWANHHRDKARDEDLLPFVLVNLLNQFCGQSDSERKPLLFVLDDFEQLLEAADPAPKRVRAEAVEPLRALLWAVKRAESDSKVLLTSRFTFTLSRHDHDLAKDLFWLALEAMPVSDSRKQARTKLRLHNVDVDRHLERLVAAGRGNPGLQDLLTQLVLEAPERADHTLTAVEAYLERKNSLPKVELTAFFKDLDLDHLMGLLSTGERELLLISTLFEVPIPMVVINDLAQEQNLAHDEQSVGWRLIGLGLWELHDRDRQPSVLLNALVRPHAGTLLPARTESIAHQVVKPLFDIWRSEGGQQIRVDAHDLQLAQLALLGENSFVLAETAENAVKALEGKTCNREASVLGRKAVAALDEKNCEPPYGLLIKTAQLCHFVGDPATAREFCQRARCRLEDSVDRADTIGMKDLGTVLGVQALLQIRAGLLPAALQNLEQARALFDRLNLRSERASVLGAIARIHEARGWIDEALLLNQEQLQIFESLEDEHGKALALGDIASIKASRGEVGEALSLHRQRLRIFESLGKERERAMALGSIARIKAAHGEVDEALSLHEERLRVFAALADERERASTLGDVARIKAFRGHMEEAFALNQEGLKVFELLGDSRSRAVTLRDMARIEVDRGRVEEALVLQEDALQVFESLEDVQSRAETLGDIARIKASRGQIDEALPMHEEALKVFERLKIPRERAIALGDIARIKASRGRMDEALSLFEEALHIFQSQEDMRERSVVRTAIARIKTSKGEVEEALSMHREALRTFESVGDIRERAITLRAIARIKASLGEIHESLLLHNEALHVFESLGDVKEAAVVRRDMARIKAFCGEVEEAIALHQEALRAFESLGDEQERVMTLSDLGRSKAISGNLEGTLSLRETLRHEFDALSDPSRKALTLWNLGHIAVENGEMSAGLEDFSNAYELSLELGHLDGISLIGVDLGRVLCSLGLTGRARTILGRSRDGFRKLGSVAQEAKVEAMLAQLQEMEPGTPLLEHDESR